MTHSELLSFGWLVAAIGGCYLIGMLENKSLKLEEPLVGEIYRDTGYSPFSDRGKVVILEVREGWVLYESVDAYGRQWGECERELSQFARRFVRSSKTA